MTVVIDKKKTYGFNDTHDETKPAQYWFEHSPEGLVLFVVFYTWACRWGRCTGCALPSLSSSTHIGFQLLMKQVDHIFSLPDIFEKRQEIHKFVVSNNGSVLDEETFSSTALMYVVAQANINFPNLAVLTLETRAPYVDVAELEFLARALKEGETPTALELAIGFEAFDDTIRNKHFQKGLTIRVFEEFAEKVARHKFRLKCYFMLKPVPGISDEEAIADIHHAIDYLDGVAQRFALYVTLHLNPTYVPAGTPLARAFESGLYTPPTLRHAVEAIRYVQGKKIIVNVGLNDEGLAVPGGSFLRPGDEALRSALHRFNHDQNFAALPAV